MDEKNSQKNFQEFTDIEKLDDRWKNHDVNLKNISSDTIDFLNNPYFGIFVRMPLKTNTKMSKNEVKVLVKQFPKMKDISVLEVGAGFGNFCRILSKKVKVSKYTILDTNTMLRFSKTFLMYYNIECNFVSTNNFEMIFDEKFDLFISNICLSETPREYREVLLNNVLPNCARLYIINADKRAHPTLDGGHFNEWLEDTIRKYFKRVIIKPIPYNICYQKYCNLYIGEK